MKISKLFHWLYALVMLLPIFAIGVTCITTFWNKEVAADNQTATINYKYDTNEVNSVEDLRIGNIYKFTIPQTNDFTDLGSRLLISTDVAYNVVTDRIKYDIIKTSSNGQISFYAYENTQSFRLITTQITADLVNDTAFYFVYKLNGLSQYGADFISYISASDFLDIEGVTINNNPTEFDTKNVFYYAVDRVTQSNLFSWAYDSFLVTPFAYIVNLFSMPTNSPVVLLLSYWLTISIIWLVFDLIMYVPLLAHRWLDKGMVE